MRSKLLSIESQLYFLSLLADQAGPGKWRNSIVRVIERLNARHHALLAAPAARGGRR